MAYRELIPEQNKMEELDNLGELSPRKGRWHRKLWPWARAHWLDLALALLFLVAVFLAVEPWGIWERLFAGLSSLPKMLR